MAKDKQGHLLIGFIIALSTGWVSIWFGIIAAATIGLMKEIYDHLHRERHTVEFLDFLATAAGGLLGVMPYVWVLHG